jgi:hypothetical protein
MGAGIEVSEESCHWGWAMDRYRARRVDITAHRRSADIDWRDLLIELKEPMLRR